MTSFGAMELLIMLLAGGGGNDLLDYIQTKAYWEAKGVPITVQDMTAELTPPDADNLAALLKNLTTGAAEARAAAAAQIKAMGPSVLGRLESAAAKADQEAVTAIQALIDQLSQAPKAGAVRRLMAIRALGDLKDRTAIPVLRRMQRSEAQFEADYATAATAAIAGISAPRPGLSAKQRALEPWLLPAECGVVGQFGMPPGKPLEFATFLKDAGPMMGGRDPNQVFRNTMGMLIGVAEKIGNIRLDTVTIGVSSDVGERTGFVVVAARGVYDAEALLRLLRETPGHRATFEQAEGLNVCRPDNTMALILPSNDRLVALFGPKAEVLPVARMAAIVKTSSGGIAEASEIGKLIQSVSGAPPLWAVAQVNDNYRQAPLLAPFASLTLTAKLRKADDGAMVQDLTLSARGSDARKTAAVVAHMEGLLAQARQKLGQAAPQMPSLQPVLDILNSAKVRADGGNATMTGTVKNVSGAALLLPWMMLGRAPAPEREVEEGDPSAGP